MANKLLIAGNTIHPDAKKTITLPEWAIDYLSEGTKPQQVAKRFMEGSWAYRCITIRAQTLSGIEWEIVRPKGDDTEAVEKNNPAVKLLREVNPEMNWIDLIRATESDLLIYGYAYWEKVGGVRPLFLNRLNPSTIEIKANTSGIVEFKQQIPGMSPRFISREDVVFFRLYNPLNDLGGLSPTRVAMPSIDAEVNAEKYVAAFFENYAMPGVFLSTTESVQEKDANRIIRWFKRNFGGAGNKHKVGFFDKGTTATQLGYSMQELAMAEVRQEARKDICATYGVPPAIAGAWEAATYNATPEQRLSLYQDTVFPQADYIASVINAELMPFFDAELEFTWKKHEVQAVQEDENKRVERYAVLVRERIISKEKAAEDLGFEPTDVPEPEPMPDFTPQLPEEAEKSIELDGAGDLRKWRRKCLKRLKDGKKARCMFGSDILPKLLIESVYGSLDGAKTAADIDGIFDDALNWSDYP